MLFMEAANFVLLLGPSHVWFLGHGMLPRPIVKKKLLSTFRGTFAGYFALFKLRNLLLKLATKEVSLIEGRVGFRRVWFFKSDSEGGVSISYSRMPANVELLKVPLAVKKGLASMKKVAFMNLGFVFNATLVVCPGLMTMILELKGLTYAASASTTVMVWFAMLKNSSLFTAALIKRRRYVFPGFTFRLNVSLLEQL
ncbi:hypothetical protein V8G54_025339 [Vigna mungo]|uniref:Uncharacterized protein n=1 Tax=Vigna mungo TaxID=3915 RepID=A0AAQ3MYT7_VIGMU